jgi:hypothetical protein
VAAFANVPERRHPFVLEERSGIRLFTGGLGVGDHGGAPWTRQVCRRPLSCAQVNSATNRDEGKMEDTRDV